MNFNQFFGRNANKIVIILVSIVLLLFVIYLHTINLLVLQIAEQMNQHKGINISFSSIVYFLFLIFIFLTLLLLVSVNYLKKLSNKVRFGCLLVVLTSVLASLRIANVFNEYEVDGDLVIPLLIYFVSFPLIFLLSKKTWRKKVLFGLIGYFIISVILSTFSNALEIVNLSEFIRLGLFSILLMIIYSPLLWVLIKKNMEIRTLILYNALICIIIDYFLFIALFMALSTLSLTFFYLLNLFLVNLYLICLGLFFWRRAKSLDELLAQQEAD